MKRLIDADELLEWSEIIPLTDDGGIDINDFEEKLKTMPTVDAVPVIRCKECKWFGKIGCAVNIVDESDKPKENDYCSWAERKANNEQVCKA